MKQIELSAAAARAALEGVIADDPPPALQLDVTPNGICGRRSQLGDAGFRALERFLLGAPTRALRVFDFTHDRADLPENVHDGKRFVSDYAGVTAPGQARVFRVDHHYPVRELERESTTPLTRRWLLALHQGGAHDLLAEIAGARYLVNHWDVDILFSQHLGDQAQDPEYVDRVGAVLSAAALRNDYLAAPPAFLEPWASKAFFAGLALEEAITGGEVAFEVALKEVCPAMGRWILGTGSEDERSRFEGWARDEQARERDLLDRIGSWEQQGLLTVRREGRLLWLDAPERIDNAALFLYLQQRKAHPGPRLQLLSYPRGGATVTYKVRSHEGFDLNPVFDVLNRGVPGASFGGRSAAGGSRPMPTAHQAVLAAIEGVLG